MNGAGLHEVVRHHAGRTPDREALVLYRADGSIRRLSWRQLDQRVGECADRLRRFGNGRPDLLIVVLGRGLKGLVSLLAASALGADVMPVDRGAEALLARAEPDRPVRWLVDGDTVTVTGRPGRTARRAPAYLISSGGTSGHLTIVPMPYPRPGPPPALFSRCGWRTGQRCYIAGARGHGALITTLSSSLADGATVVLTDIFDPTVVCELLAAERVEWAQMMPMHMRQLQPYLDRSHGWASLRAVLHMAASCPPDTKRAWITALGAERVYEMYGATEGIGVTMCRGDEWLQRVGTVGRGFLCQIRIVKDGIQVPDGTVGTVYLRSVPSRHLPDAEPVFRTVGDLGRVDGDGYLYLAGRADQMVVVDGENVYLDDVTDVVLSHPQVADAAVISVEDRSGARLVGVVVPRPGGPLSPRHLTEHCLASLPVLAVPRRWRLVDSLQRTASGKTPKHVLKRLAEMET